MNLKRFTRGPALYIVLALVLVVAVTAGLRGSDYKSTSTAEVFNYISSGQVSTDTLEVRTALALTGRVDDAVWDLPRRWFTRAAPVRSLVCGRQEWPLADRGRWVLGRDLECDVLLGGDDAVSRRHAEIAVRAGICLVRDLDSSVSFYRELLGMTVTVADNTAALLVSAEPPNALRSSGRTICLCASDEAIRRAASISTRWRWL